MKDNLETYYAEWDKCHCDGETYTLVIVPTKRVAFLLYHPYDIRAVLWGSGFHFNLGLTRNRDLSRDISGDKLKQILNGQGLFFPDEELNVVSFPSRILQLYLV